MPPMQTDWDKLPDHVRHSPHVVDLRLTTLEKQGVHILETHARTHINLGSMLSHPVKTPVGNLPLGIAAAGRPISIGDSQNCYRRSSGSLGLFNLGSGGADVWCWPCVPCRKSINATASDYDAGLATDVSGSASIAVGQSFFFTLKT